MNFNEKIEEIDFYISNCVSAVVRSGPGTTHPIIIDEYTQREIRYGMGTVVKVYEIYNGEWGKVHPDQDWWIGLRYLKPLERFVPTRTKHLQIKESQSAVSNTVLTVRHDSILYGHPSKSGRWVHIIYPCKGYVEGNWLKKL